MISTNQKAIERVTAFWRNFATDPVTHQDRDHYDRQQRRTRHRIRFGERQRAKQTPFLPFQGEDRDKRQRDNQQTDKQRRTHFNRRIGDHLPARFIIQRGVRMLVLPLFQPFMRILDHDDSGIDHRPDGNRNAAQRHNIGVQSLKVHDNKSNTQPQRQRNNRHQRRAHMPEKQRTDYRHHNKLFQQLAAEVVDGAVNELAAIVCCNYLHAFRQTTFQRFQFVFHGGDHFSGVFAGAQDHHPARHFAFAAQFGNAPAHLRANLDLRNITQINGHAIFTGF